MCTTDSFSMRWERERARERIEILEIGKAYRINWSRSQTQLTHSFMNQIGIHETRQCNREHDWLFASWLFHLIPLTQNTLISIIIIPCLFVILLVCQSNEWCCVKRGGDIAVNFIENWSNSDSTLLDFFFALFTRSFRFIIFFRSFLFRLLKSNYQKRVSAFNIIQ